MVRLRQVLSRKHERTKTRKKIFVLSNFRVFVINSLWFPDERDPPKADKFTLRSNRLARVRLVFQTYIHAVPATLRCEQRERFLPF
jgi:hypothetical protein